MSNKNENGECSLTVSQLYETLKSSTFLRDLYWDILSSIKEKNTYKHIKETSEKLIKQEMEALDRLTDSDADNVRRKAIVTQICSMSYAIDTVYSKILYMKLEKACESQIPNLIKELRNEGKIPDAVWSLFKLESSEAQVSNEVSKVRSKTTEQKVSNVTNATDSQNTGISHPSPPLKKRKLRNSEVNADDKKEADISFKDIIPNDTDKKKAHLPKKRQLGGRIQASIKKSASVPVTSTPKKEVTNENVDTLSNVSNKVDENSTLDIPKDLLGDGSDAESEISLGNVSMTSVSSVHTSDLSSFDDEISLSSGDEGDGKKTRLSIKELQEKISQNVNFSLKIKEEIITPEDSLQSKVSTVDTAGSSTETASGESANERELPKRIRKPNSRYSSDNIIRTSVKVKERKKSLVAAKNGNEKNSSDEFSPKRKRKMEGDKLEVGALNKTSIEVKERKISLVPTKVTNGKNSSDELSPKRKVRIENGNMEVDTSNKDQKVDEEKNSADADVKSVTKQHGSSDLFKPQPPIRSLTSRRTAPVTLYST